MEAVPNEASERVRAARARAAERRLRHRSRLRPIGLVMVPLVVIPAVAGHPAPSLSGSGLALTIALVGWVAGLAVLSFSQQRRPSANEGEAPRLGEDLPDDVALVVAGVAGVVIAGVQPNGDSVLPVSVAVLVAYLRFRPRVATAVIGPLVAALAVVELATVRSDTEVVLAAILLEVVLAFAGALANRARQNQDRTEVLLAELEDARDAEAMAVAAAERARIARELHDVLAHSLSGLSIQLQLARKLAEREQAGGDLQEVIGRAAALTRDGLADAQRAVGALRGDALPTVDELPGLVERYRRDLRLDVSLVVRGQVRHVAPDASLALYRGAQEALTNAARYAPDAATVVTLDYRASEVRLTVEDDAAVGNAAFAEAAVNAAVGNEAVAVDEATADNGAVGDGTAGVRRAVAARTPVTAIGGGNGLAGMRERVERAEGTLRAGPTPRGWLVEMTVPA